MRSAKPIRMKKPVRAKKSVRSKKGAARQWWTSPPVIAGAVVVVIAAGAMIAAYQSASEQSHVASANVVAAEKTEQATAALTPVGRAETRRTPAPPAAPRVAAAVAGAGTAPAAAAAPESTSVHADADDQQPAVADSSAMAAAAPVTIVGCLERDDDVFRLKDAAGIGVPKTRSWKSGFLKKSAPTIEVVDAAKRLKLSNHVGERVSITGTLLDRRMSVRSLQRIANSCDGPARTAN